MLPRPLSDCIRTRETSTDWCSHILCGLVSASICTWQEHRPGSSTSCCGLLLSFPVSYGMAYINDSASAVTDTAVENLKYPTERPTHVLEQDVGPAGTSTDTAEQGRLRKLSFTK